MVDNMEQKKAQLQAIYDKINILPESMLDYATGFIDGISVAYDKISTSNPPQKSA